MLENPKHKLNNEIDKYKIEIESKNKEINELKDKLSKLEVNSRNELKAQTEYLNGIIEGYKKNIENIKDQKIKTEKDLNKLNEKLEIELGNCKIQLANFQYEMDRKIITYKKYINKLQTKLESLGFKFKDKKNHNKITFDKVNNIV